MYRALQLQICLLVCMVLVTACGGPVAGTSLAGTPVTDEEFYAAVEQAHDTMNILLESLLAPNPSYRFVGVKARFTGKNVEFEDHWTEPTDYYNDVFTVRMLDGLTFNNGLNANRLVEVPIRNILDWMIVESDGNLVGGYTIRLTYDHMTPEEKEQFIKVTGYKIK